MTSTGLYPSALPLAARLGRFPSWAEYMAQYGPSLYIPEPQLIQDHTYSLRRGLIDDTLPIYYEAGPIYENDEDGWVDVKVKRHTVEGRRRMKKSKKAAKKEQEQIQQQTYFAKNVSFSGNTDLLDA